MKRFKQILKKIISAIAIFVSVSIVAGAIASVYIGLYEDISWHALWVLPAIFASGYLFFGGIILFLGYLIGLGFEDWYDRTKTK